MRGVGFIAGHPRISAAGFAVLVVGLAVDGDWAAVAIVGVVGLATGVLLSTSRTERRLERLLESQPDSPDPRGEPSEAVNAIVAFDEAIHTAAGVPLTDQVRLDREKVTGLLDRVRTAFQGGDAKTVATVHELDELVRRAKPIPLTNEIRLDREEAYDVLDRLMARAAAERSRRS